MSKSKKRKAEFVTSVRFTAVQYEAVLKAAADRGQGKATFIQAAALRAAGRPAPAAKRSRTPDVVALGALKGSVDHVGSLMEELCELARVGRANSVRIQAVERAVWVCFGKILDLIKERDEASQQGEIE